MGKHPSWLFMTSSQLSTFMNLIYEGVPDVNVDKLNDCWWQCCLVEKGECNEFKMMSRIIASNGLAVGVWIGAIYIQEMIVSLLG